MLTSDQVIQKLKAETNRAAVHRATGLPYMYLQRIVHGIIRNPGSRQMDILRSYYEQRTQ